MEYFYAFIDNQKNKDFQLNMLEEQLKMKKQQVYIDEDEKGNVWNQLMETLNEFDKLYVPSFYMFSPDEEKLKARLERLKEIRAKLYLIEEEQDIDIDVLLDMLDYVESIKKERLAIKQREGIEKALKKKELGEGAYGRPRLDLPEDFEENIKAIMRKEMNHETYREKIGMKRSTYYKYVKLFKDRWKQETLK